MNGRLMHLIAGTIIIEDKENKVKFLANKTNRLFVLTEVSKEKTALSAIIDEMKTIVDIDFDQLELVELTNAEYNGNNMPLYVLSYKEDVDEIQTLIDDSDIYGWLNHRELQKTFEQLNIQGVPNFK